MGYNLQIWNRAMQGGLIVFLTVFVALSLFLYWRLGGRRGSLSRQIDAEYHRPNPSFAALAAPAILPAVFRAWWTSVSSGVVATLVLALTPLSYFPNFSTGPLLPAASVELKSLKTILQGDPMKIDGEVTNISDRPLPKLQVHLILYDRHSTPIAVRTIEMRKDLLTGQTMPFFFTEPRADSARRVGITFSSQYRPLLHRESAEVKQQP